MNNVKYNFGTQSYDDFIMKPFCHNTLYDLANGGGKSVLMLLMLQTVLPNCTLDDKQPVEKLFRTGDGSQTIHSLIEWKLDDLDVVNGFQYMTTGFCAKKAAQAPLEEEKAKDAASIEYFNYCIFYREYNENDIRNLPLVKEKERITYQGLRKYLKELERDNSYMVYVFDKKREYQSFISRYGLYESEWEIIRGINKTEGHVRTYFETNYKTTRKVVEDLLIEEIIQKSLYLKAGEQEETMSKTLLDIREKLMELAKRKSEIHNYDRQMELLSNFSSRLESLLHLYEQKQVCEKELSCIHTFALSLEQGCELQYTKQGEEIQRLKDSIHTYLKRLEQSKVYQGQKKLSLIRQEISVLNAEYENKQAMKARVSESLNRNEAMNDYLEYLEEKQKRNEATEALHALQSKNSGLSTEISTYVFFMKQHLEELKDCLADEIKDLEQQSEKLKSSLASDKEHQVRVLQELAVSESFVSVAKDKKAELMKDISSMKSQVGLLLLEELEEAKKENDKECLQLEARLQSVKNQLEEIEGFQKQTQISVAKLELELGQLLSKEQEEQEFLSRYAKEKIKAEQLLVAYGQKDYQNLKLEIHARLKKSIQTTSSCRQEMMDITQELKRLERGEFSLDGQWLENAKESLMSRYPISIKTGLEYLSELDEEKKIETIVSYPYLPYALVLMSEEEHTDVAYYLPGKEYEKYVIPLITMKALHSSSYEAMKADLQLIARDQSMLFDEKRLTMEKERLRRELEEVRKKITRLEDQETTYSEDEAYIHIFTTNLFAKFREVSEQNYNTKAAIADLKQSIKELHDSYAASQQTQGNLNESLLSLKKSIEEEKDKSILYAELSTKAKEYEKECEKEEIHLQRREKLTPVLNEVEFSILESSKEIELIRQQIQAKQQRITESINLWENKYRMFYVKGEFTKPDLSMEEMTSKLNGALAAMETKYTDLEDKNRLITSYVQAMNRCLKSIESKGISISELEELRAKDALHATSEADLVILQQEFNQLSKEVMNINESLTKLKDEANRLEGSTEQTIASYQEKFGQYVEEIQEEVDVASFIMETKEKIAILEKQERLLSNGLATLMKEKEQFAFISKDIKRMLGKVSFSDQIGDSINLSQMSGDKLNHQKEQLEKQWFKFEKELRQKEEEFNQNKQKTREALIALNAVGLAQELQTSVKFTKGGEETLGLIHSLSQVNECLQLEKDRITSGLKDMIQIKDNFENQCLQRCMHIKTELERLPKLSRITLEGELIPMISLSIPYVKEEFYKEKMSHYIDELVNGADAFTDVTDRLKYIRNALSLKKLFSVIVTDMNAIKLSLYKRERIKEQSRHLRYEEAVGSTGQSQGIYTQFLIAIITYISNINSHRSDNPSLRKVIFIDNPFGAAKDIYIWEPIFELLEQNQVQMIVPARGTTPAITSRFDVNYVLGQKLIDNRQQTVVVDYRSSINAREAEFIPLKYEQTSFDLLDVSGLSC